MTEIETLLNAIFDIMNREFHSPYIVMNKYDEVPYKLPSDLDMSITPEDFSRLDKVMTAVARGVKLAIVQKIWHGYQKCAYLFSPIESKGRFRLQLDFFTDFSVKGTPLLISYKDMQQDTRCYGRFTIPSYRMEYVFLLMRRIFKNDFDAEHLAPIQTAMNGDKDGSTAYLKSFIGDELATKVNQYVEQNEIGKLQALRPELWRKMQLLSKKRSRGMYKLKFRLAEISRYWYRIKYPVGYCVTLLSPDGGGKSSIFERIEYTCWGSFHGIKKMYFRPHLMRNPGMLNPINPVPESADNPDPHGKKPNGFVKSLIRYFYYNIDYILGYNLLVRKMCIQKQLVVFDRYYYDYFVDLKRYRYSFPSWIPRAFAWSIPSPDLILVLEGTPEVLYNRKKELPLEEIRRQTKAYHAIAERFSNAVLINVDEPLDKVVVNVTREILLRKALRTAKGMRNKLDANGIPINN